MSTTAKVAVIMGSKNDLPKIQPAIDLLGKLCIPVTVRVTSAHRTPDAVRDFAVNAKANGIKVIIAAAGGAAHLAGMTASHTALPVIGIPVEGGHLNGLDALLSTVQMPGGVAVATVGIGAGGATNAGLLAAQILALSDEALAARLDAFRAHQSAMVALSDAEVVALHPAK